MNIEDVQLMIKKRRKELKQLGNHINQAELAKIIGISLRSYSRIEIGETEPTLDQVNRIAEALDTTPEYLLQITNSAAAAPSIKQLDLTQLTEDKLTAMITKALQMQLVNVPKRNNIDPVKVRNEILAFVSSTRREDLPKLLDHVKSFRTKD